jgi:hypothetical protein
MGTCHFQAPTGTKTPWPLVLKFCTVDYVGETTKSAKNGYNRMARGGSPYRWYLVSIYLTLPYLTLPYLFCFVTKPTDQTTEPICTHDISNDADCSKEVPFGVSSMKKFFTGEYPFPKIFKGHFTCKSKKSNNFGQVKDNRKIPKPTYTKSGQTIERWLHFRSSTPPSGRNRLSAIFGNNKRANNVETVQDRR